MNKKTISNEKLNITPILLILYDVFAVNVSYFIALWLRFDMMYTSIPSKYLEIFIKYALIHTITAIVVIFLFKLYKSLWKYASIDELVATLCASLIIACCNVVGSLVLFGKMPISYYLMGWIIMFCMITGVRFSYRFFRTVKHNGDSGKNSINTMLIGAGDAGRMLIQELSVNNKYEYSLCCAIDDDASKIGRTICNIPVVGTRNDILPAVEKYDIKQIIYAIPSSTPEQRRDILSICNETKCNLKILPSIYSLVSDHVSLKQLKDVSVEELLGRESIKVNLDEIMDYVSGTTVLVTGGGGSIGSEICRQIANHSPKRLIIFDIYENNAYNIQQELLSHHPELDLSVIIGSVRDSARLDQVFERYTPDIVFHAAAHKHVPLMEDSPNEAIKNNVFGTYKLTLAAHRYGVKRFVLISTDKAVNPTNIMGASKRICEMIIQMMNRRSDTEFVAVRFGNVLGSNGSVVPLFKRQISEGGPVTVTHPDIIRYFMTIPEAVALVLQAGAYANGGEIFVFDMGEPVKIDTLARNLIKLSGYTPDVDIKIEYVGLRPGEKLYEELLLAEEGMAQTANKLIHIGHPIEMDDDKLMEQLDGLQKACCSNSDNIRELVSEIVPTYTPTAEKKSAAPPIRKAAQ